MLYYIAYLLDDLKYVVLLILVTSVDSPGVSKVLEQAIALFDYQSQQSDELGFLKGNLINVLSKEHADWWMGELNGQTGIFPANFVGPLS